MTSKELFYSEEAEKMVLGCMLTNCNAFQESSESLDETDFFVIRHQEIFSALKKAYSLGRPNEIVLIAEDLKQNSKLEAAGIIQYLMDLAQYAGTSAWVREYVDQILKYSKQRQLIRFTEECRLAALDNKTDLEMLIEKTIKHLNSLSIKGRRREEVSIGDVLSGKKSKVSNAEAICRIRERQAHYLATGKPFISGVSTGLVELDKQVTLLEDTNLIIIAARPSVGKTALALTVASNLSGGQSYSVAVISLEMGSDQLTERFLSMRSRVSGEKIKRGILSDEEIERLAKQDQLLRGEKIFIYDDHCHTVSEVIQIGRQAKDSKDIKLLVIDYLQLLSGNARADSRQYEVAEISRKLKLLAMELRIPIICIAQLSRKVEERADKKPLLSDLRDSGQIEQDADSVLFIYREEYYSADDIKNKGVADLIVAKNRHGPLPSVKVHFDKECGLFSNLDGQSKPSEAGCSKLRFDVRKHIMERQR